MFFEVFLRDYFENDMDLEALTERLAVQLVEEGTFAGPVNSIEDADVEDIDITERGAAFEGDVLVLRAQYTVKVRYFYVDREEQDDSFLSGFEVAGRFRFVETDAEASGGDLRVAYRLEEALPMESVKTQFCDIG